jgi:polysaccharide deacetylase 2 family uncharacterized protein YibQ
VGVLFWLLFAVAIGAGGQPALEGLPLLADAVLPQGLFAAQAARVAPAAVVSMTLHGSARASPFGPQILTPVVARTYPDWLTTRIADRSDMIVLRGGEAGVDLHIARAMESPPPGKARPMIALVIDDLGSDVPATRRAIRLPAGVTLSFLPYPDATPALAHRARDAGHQILVHVPMEPEGRDDPGPHALLTELGAGENAARLDWALARVPGFSGINNHMGSRFTAERSALLPVVETLADRHVFFLDSRTTPRSVVIPLAHAFGVASAGRDVFLDDEHSAGSVGSELALAERVAREQGVAIAIGHPHAATLSALEDWLAHLQGFEIVPVGDAIRREAERQALVAARE